jgi:hypothetical protein
MFDLALKILKKVDPKWMPAIVIGMTLVSTITYLVYAKKRAESLNRKLKKKLALAESSALSQRSNEIGKAATAKMSTADKASEEAAIIKAEIETLKSSTSKKRDKLLKATTWEDLGL